MVPTSGRSQGPPGAGRGRALAVALTLLLLGMLATGFVVRTEAARLADAAHAEREQHATRLVEILDAFVQRYADVGAGLAEAIAREPDLDHDVYEERVGRALRRAGLEGLLGANYVRRIDRDGVEAAIVTHVYPFDTNAPVVGYNSFETPGAAVALARSAEFDMPVLSTPLRLRQAPDRDDGLVLYVPVSGDDTVIGWIGLPFRGQDVLDAVASAIHGRVEVSAPDVDGNDVVIGTIPAAPRPELDPDAVAVRELFVHGQPWRVESDIGEPTAPLWRTTPGETFLTGTLVTAALAALAFVVMRSRDRLSHQVHLRTEQLQQTNAELAAANEELARSSRAKDELLAVVSHELRTPLTVIRGLTSALLTFERDELPELAGQSLDRIDRHAERLDELVGDLLLSARLASRDVVAERSPIDLGRALGAITDDPAYGDLDVTLDIENGLVALVDVEHLGIMIRSLLSNVAKYGEPPVTIHAAASGGQVEIAVRDAGPGVPEQLRPALFEPFTQEEMSNQRTSTGTGLGLSIVRQLSELNGGSARYEHDDGPAFVIVLPSASAADDAGSGTGAEQTGAE